MKKRLKTHSTTSIYLHRDTWELLRRVAIKRAERDGPTCRISVSGVINALVEKSKHDLEKEVTG